MTDAALPCDDDCIFCKIVSDAIPCHKLYEDDHLLALLDVAPLSRGHCLVIPKGHWDTLDQVPAPVGGTIGRLLPTLAKAVCEVSGTGAYNVLQNNGAAAHQAVMHVHFHIIPKTNGDGLDFTWNTRPLEDAQAIRDAIVHAMTQ